MNFSVNQLSDLQVFLNDQFTTTLYTLVTAQSNSSCSASQQDSESINDQKLIATENSPQPDSYTPNSLMKQDIQIPHLSKRHKNEEKANFYQPCQSTGNKSRVKGSQVVHQIITDCKVIIVIQDFYQDCLAIRPFFQELANQLQSQEKTFVLCNLPGQAYTQYNPESSNLNNSYHADCLDLLLYYLQERNQIDIMGNPYCIIGFGSGANIALIHAYQVSETTGTLKGVLTFNGFSYMDDIMKDSIQTCIDSYQNCPEELQKTHGDFYLRNLVLTTGTLLLSEYIKTIQQETAHSASYAAHCKILSSFGEIGKKQDVKLTLSMMKQRQDGFITGGQKKQAKIDVCKGLLDYIDIKHSLSLLRVPIIVVQSRKNCFVHHNHSDALRDVSSLNKFYKHQLQSGKNLTTISDKQTKNDDILEDNNNQDLLAQGDEQKIKNNDIHRAIYHNIPRFQIFIDGGHNVLLQNPVKTKQIIMNFIQAPVKHSIKSTLLKANSDTQSIRSYLSTSPIVHAHRNTTQETSHFQKNSIKQQENNDDD